MSLAGCQIYCSELDCPVIIISPPKEPAPANEYPKFKQRHKHRLHKRSKSDIRGTFLSPCTRKDHRAETQIRKPRIPMKSPENNFIETKPKEIITKASQAEYSADVCKCTVM